MSGLIHFKGQSLSSVASASRLGWPVNQQGWPLAFPPSGPRPISVRKRCWSQFSDRICFEIRSHLEQLQSIIDSYVWISCLLG